jgi:sulfur-carrier protein
MTTKILTFGQITDITGISDWNIQDVKTTDEFRKRITELYPALNLIKYTIAVNKNVVHENKDLNDGDIVALLPPLSGG